MTDRPDIPEGYSYEPSVSAFINHIGHVYSRRTAGPNGDEVWAALRIEPHHVNAWNLCHGAVMASMAEIGTAGPGWDPEGPPVVAIEMSMQFIGAPKLGDLLEVRGILVKRTRSLVFTRAEAEVDGKPIFTATSVQKVIGN
jgi:acyl-coenzyme A thioesterase PaaI-like protein